jgi:hypothetical protein
MQVGDSNPWRAKTDDELLHSADEFAAAQEQMAARAAEDSEHWHHRAVAWLLHELAARLRRRA